jgi:hypothetical protein
MIVTRLKYRVSCASITKKPESFLRSNLDGEGGAVVWKLAKDDALSWCGHKLSAKCCDATNCI